MLRRDPEADLNAIGVASLVERGASAGVTTLSRAVLKRDRLLPVQPRVASALRAVGLQGGLARGSVSCITGPFRVSFAIALLAQSSAAGSWTLWCSPSAPNCRALLDAGWQLNRFVWVDPAGQWVACMGAGIGEFETVITQLPRGVPLRDVRHVAAVAHRSNGALVVLAEHPHDGLSPDLVFETRDADWSVAGAGHLASQEVHVVLGGRRAAEPRGFSVVLGAS